MLTINPNDKINAEDFFSKLMSRKIMIPRFRLPYTDEQVYTMLLQACRAEVASRYRKFDDTGQFRQHIRDIAKWLTADTPYFGLFLCGGVGNGKTTILRALQSLIAYLRSDEPYSSRQTFPIRGYRFITAKELVQLAKANANRDSEATQRYRQLLDSEILAIDDLGQEPKEAMHYGDYVTAAMDVLSYRYDHRLCTLVSSNLAPKKVIEHYDARIADRFREMMHIVNFSSEKSFRT